MSRSIKVLSKVLLSPQLSTKSINQMEVLIVLLFIDYRDDYPDGLV